MRTQIIRCGPAGAHATGIVLLPRAYHVAHGWLVWRRLWHNFLDLLAERSDAPPEASRP